MFTLPSHVPQSTAYRPATPTPTGPGAAYGARSTAPQSPGLAVGTEVAAEADGASVVTAAAPKIRAMALMMHITLAAQRGFTLIPYLSVEMRRTETAENVPFACSIT
jgi:hypothetical protein